MGHGEKAYFIWINIFKCIALFAYACYSLGRNISILNDEPSLSKLCINNDNFYWGTCNA